MDTFSFTVELPASVAERIATAVCARHGYNPDSGITPVEFTRQITMRWLGEVTISHEAEVAASTAANSVRENQNDPLVAMLSQGSAL